MAKPKVLICDLISPPAEIERAVFGPDVEIIAAQASGNADISNALWNSCDAVIAYDRIKYDLSVIQQLQKCKVIVRAGIGVDNIDIAEAKKQGITVCNVPDYCMPEVADHTMALLLSLVRGIPEHLAQMREGVWARTSKLSFRLEGKTMGFIGMGRTARATARRAQAFGLKIIYFDPQVTLTEDSGFKAERVPSLEAIATSSDIISVHTPLNPQTFQMINVQFFKKVKKGAVLLNATRGPVIDLNALYAALKSDTVLCCGIDALPSEFSEDSHKLITALENEEEWLRGRFLLTAHTAYYSHEAMIDLRKKSAMEVKRILDGEEPLNPVN